MQEWRKSSFRQRNLLLKTLVKYIVEHQDTICRSVPALLLSALAHTNLCRMQGREGRQGCLTLSAMTHSCAP